MLLKNKIKMIINLMIVSVAFFYLSGCGGDSGKDEGSSIVTVDFSFYDDVYTDLKSSDGVLKFTDGINDVVFSKCVEPEYITVSEDSKTAWVSLQENNAIAIIDLEKKKITAVRGLGFKHFGAAGNGIDASDKDGNINITTYSNVYGMYQPDAIKAVSINGEDYVLSANEGDDAWGHAKRVKKLELDSSVFPDASTLQDNDNLGRLKVFSILGDTDSDGDYDGLYAWGGRSFSIWSSGITQVYDSGDGFEKQIDSDVGNDVTKFNLKNDEYKSSDNDTNSDRGGCDPEGITAGTVGTKIYAFIALEKQGGVMVYDITTPSSASFVCYENTRQYLTDIESEKDLGPEGVCFVSASDSPTGRALLLVANEVSGTVIVYEVTEGNMELLARYDSGAGFDNGGAEIVDFHSGSGKMFITNGYENSIDVVDISTLTNTGSVQALSLYSRISIAAMNISDAGERSLTSCAVHPTGEYLAVALPAADKTENGCVVFTDLDGNIMKTEEVGALPDMVTFSPDGKYCLVANEGEPAELYFDDDLEGTEYGSSTIDPIGSVSIITME